MRKLTVLFLLFASFCSGQSRRSYPNMASAQRLPGDSTLLITVYKKASYMFHDPASLLKPRQYYLDSARFVIPNRIGHIKPTEIVDSPKKHAYPFIRGGIELTKDSIRFELYF